MEFDMKMIALGIVLIVILIILYNTFTTVPVNKNSASKLGEKNKTVNYKGLANPASPNYYISAWLFVENIQNTKDQVLYEIKTENTSVLVVKLKPNGQLVYTAGITDGDGNIKEFIVLPSFPIQQWCCFVLSVDSNKLVDSYINGKLVKSHELKSAETITSTSDSSKIEQSDLKENNVIYIAKFERIPKTMDPATAWKAYQDGNGGDFISKMFSSYGLSLRLTNDGNVHSSIGFPRGGITLGDMSLKSEDE